MEYTDLTSVQQRILDVIKESMTSRNYAPSMREIGESVGLSSTASVSHQLNKLELLGFISRDPRRPRTIDLLGEEPIAETFQPNAAMVPLVGRIAAGGPITAEQNVEDVFALPRQLVGQGDLFLLKVVGESMTQRFAMATGLWCVSSKLLRMATLLRPCSKMRQPSRLSSSVMVTPGYFLGIQHLNLFWEITQ